jgi:hypothetical protein
MASALALAAGTLAMTAGPASAGPYPPAEISRTLFINPFDTTAGDAWLPYSSARTIYLTQGNYSWTDEFDPTWTSGAAAAARRGIYLNSNWYYWRCWARSVQVDVLNTAVESQCSLTPTDGSTPTAYLDINPVDDNSWDALGAGDYNWYSILTWTSL